MNLHIDGSHVINLLSYDLVPGPHAYDTLQNVLEKSKLGLTGREGVWVIRANESKDTDEYGWVCINWPLYLHRLPWHHQTAPYLRSTGHGISHMRQRPLKALDEAYTQIDDLKAGLLHALPPGALLEADNPFFRQLVRAFLLPHQGNEFNSDPLEAYSRNWSFFRFGALSTTSEKSLTAITSKYSPLSPVSISKIDDELLRQCPDFIRALVAAFIRGRSSEGKGWQKWGLAWTKAGLVFNYQIAMFSLEQDFSKFTTLFPGYDRGSVPLVGAWFDPAYLQSRPNLRGIPPLGSIARGDLPSRHYARQVTEPYRILFQDPDSSVADNHVFHDCDYRMLFTIKHGDKMNLLKYFKQLITLSENKLSGEDVYAINTRAHVVPIKPPPEGGPVFETHRVAFNALNLGSLQELPHAKATHIPFSMTWVPYRNTHYVTYPDSLIELLPVLNNPELYKHERRVCSFQWVDDDYGAWQLRLHKASATTPGHSPRTNAFDLELKFDRHCNPRVYKPQGQLFLHPQLFSKVDTCTLFRFLDTCVKSFPDPESDKYEALKDGVSVLKNFWLWIYDAERGYREGKYSEEFVYPLGQETTHCPQNLVLNNTVKRMQFIVDKALHANEPHVAFAPGTERSKKANSYDHFLFWYVAHHEIANMPWKLDKIEQAQYITKRWMPWRRVLSAKNHLVNPYPVHPKKFEHPHIEEVFMYANENFGTAFTQF